MGGEGSQRARSVQVGRSCHSLSRGGDDGHLASRNSGLTRHQTGLSVHEQRMNIHSGSGPMQPVAGSLISLKQEVNTHLERVPRPRTSQDLVSDDLA